MPSIRATITAVAGVALLGLTAACEKPNLDATGGGYEDIETSSTEADTGQTGPHEEPAPGDTSGTGTGAAIEH